MEQLAPHERLFVDPDLWAEDMHSDTACHECHGGNPSDPDWLTAHEGLRRDPSYPPQDCVCADCHEEQAGPYASSLHATLAPFADMAARRAGGKDTDKVERARRNHCTSCHASCGQCHVSRPSSVQGGLLRGHRFEALPPTRNVCTACHGSRVEREYFGKNEGSLPDVHQEKHMRCSACHTGDEMHGDGLAHANRYDVTNGPRCAGCHEAIYAEGAPNAAQHAQHRGKASCQVCHAMPYKQCYNCHFGRDEHGYKYFKTEESALGFKIGLNPLRSAARPEQYATLRHVPVDPASYRFYMDSPLAAFDALPTWKLATPHNIRRRTPQNESCAACHNDKALFLRPNDVRPAERKANARVVVPDARIAALAALHGKGVAP